MEMSIRFPNLDLNFDYIPQSFQVLGVNLSLYGIFIMVGMLLGLVTILLEARRNKENVNEYLGMFLVLVLGGTIGARLFYAAFSWGLYKGNLLKLFEIRSGGLAFYGALLGGVFAGCIYCAVRKCMFMKMADTMCLGLLIGQVVGRFGDFFNRESFGGFCDNVLAMQLPLSAVRTSQVTSELRENLIQIDEISFIQVHPLFLYESVWCLLLLLILMTRQRKKYYHGEIFLKYLAGYGLGRFVIELLRTDKILWPGTNIAVCAWISLILFVLFTIVSFVKQIMSKKREERRKKRTERLIEAQEKMAAEEKQEHTDSIL